VTELDELIRRVVERAAQTPAGGWITGSGYELEAYPHHQKLSAATPDHPVWLVRKDAHSGLANAKAMAGGKGLPLDGVFVEDEMLRFQGAIPEQTLAADFLAAQRDAMQLGITGVHDAMVDEDYLRLLRSLEDGRSLRLRVHAMFWHENADRVIEFMRSTKPSSGRLSVRAIKLFMDGSLGSSTAWMLSPFCGPAAGQGVARLTSAEVERIGRVARETGWQMCVHAIGDRANRELLEAYERLDPPDDARWRIEHAQHVDPSDLPRFSRWIASVQPSHCVADRKMVEQKLGPGRYAGSYAWKRLGRLALGTDAPVDRLDPRWTFYCAITREGWGDGQGLTREEALRGMTSGAAHAGFMDSGVLAPGRPADMAVLSHDWLEGDPRQVLESSVLATMMDGRVGYQSKDLRG
jgi:predicted amidohydrolase YtcJ